MEKKLFFLLFLVACSSPKLSTERIFISHSDELYENGVLKPEVKVITTDKFIDRSKSKNRTYQRKTYLINNHPVMFEFINPPDSFPTRICYTGPNMWDDYDLRGPSLEYRRFYLPNGIIKEISYYSGFDSLKRRKFEGPIAKIEYLNGQIKDSLYQEWYERGYKFDSTRGKYFWQQWDTVSQLKEETLYRNGRVVKYSYWYNNGMLSSSTDSILLREDSAREIRRWHKNGVLSSVRVEDKNGLWIEGYNYNNFGKLIQEQNIINGRGEIKSKGTSWSVDGNWKYTHTTIGNKTEILQYYKNTLVAKIVNMDDKRFSEEYFTNDSSMYYMLLAKNLPHFVNEPYSREEYLKKRDEYFGLAVIHDSTNIEACVNKLKSIYTENREEDILKRHLLNIENEKFDSEELLSLKSYQNFDESNQSEEFIAVLAMAINKAMEEGNFENLRESYRKRAFTYYKLEQYSKACENLSKFIEYSFLKGNRSHDDLNLLKFKYREIIKHCN